MTDFITRQSCARLTSNTDDHKVVYERLLNLAVPADPEGKGIKLEDCLEEYFNTKVDVSRDGVTDEKGERPVLNTRTATVRLVQDNSEEQEEADDQVSDEPLQRTFTVDNPDEAGESSTADPDRPTIRHRSTSIIQRIVIDDKGKATDSDGASLLQKAKRKGSTVVKAVTIPAWQFYRLIRKFDKPLFLNLQVVFRCLKLTMMGMQPGTRQTTTNQRRTGKS